MIKFLIDILKRLPLPFLAALGITVGATGVWLLSQL